MNRFYLGSVLLIILFLGCTGIQLGMQQMPVTRQLEQAVEFYQAGDDRHAAQAVDEARKNWQMHRMIVSAIAGHREMEQIDIQFAQLENVPAGSAGFSSRCIRLAGLTHGLADAHRFTLWNFL